MSELQSGVAEMIERLPELKQRLRRLDNRALFELPEILAEQLHAAAIPVATRLSSGTSNVTA
jgi:hypothetical protein